MVDDGFGKLTKGSHPKDDALPCGTKLWLGEKGRTESILLCAQCKKMIAS